ncbi:MAG: DUF2207 domain-containing protein [Bacilli bacterium]
MRKTLKYFVLLLIFIPFFIVNAEVTPDYKVNKLYINSEIEIAGALHVKELIEVEGSLNGYIRDIYFKDNSVMKFDKTKNSLYSSDIYNGTSIDKISVGIGHTKINGVKDFTDEFIKKNITMFEGPGNQTYNVQQNNDSVNIKMYNETSNGYALFYIDYVITNLVVEHDDVAEFYYPFIGKNYKDEIEEVAIYVFLPSADKNLKVWAHGPLNGESFIIEGGKGAVLKVNNLRSTTTDLRLAYDKTLFPININESKKSHMEALPLILEIENEKADSANKERMLNKLVVYGVGGLSVIYIVGLIFFFVVVYKKYDKEYKSSFKQKYNREFIDDYNVEIIDYLMKKKISTNAFSASILNLIYKKNIEVESATKKDYTFTLLNTDNVNESESILIDLLFTKIGSNNKVMISEIKKSGKKTSSAGKNVLYEGFISWQNNVEKEAVNLNFFENNNKTTYLLYGVFGAIASFLVFYFGISILLFVIIAVSSFLFIIYVLSVSKRSPKGNEDYNKWNAFKNFLNDFGRFDEKELPEIKLWERYLVYATIFGLASKVQKTMKIKIEEINPNYSSQDMLFDYMMYSSFAPDLNASVTSSVNSAISAAEISSSSSSSGGGSGGGFSGGSSFGGGGGGSGF